MGCKGTLSGASAVVTACPAGAVTRHLQFAELSSEHARGASATPRSVDLSSAGRRRSEVRFQASLAFDLCHLLPAADAQGRRSAAVALSSLNGFGVSRYLASYLRHAVTGLRNRRLLVRIQWGVLDLRQFAFPAVPRYNFAATAVRPFSSRPLKQRVCEPPLLYLPLSAGIRR